MAEPTTLTKQGLNRALLARQMLLSREGITPLRAIERLFGMQAQQPRPPFTGLWTRLEGFKRESLLELIHKRKVVRATMMRATIHLVSAKDYLAFRNSIQPALSGGMQSILKGRLSQADIEAVIAAGGRLFGEEPQTFGELRTALLKNFPGADERAMGYLIRTQIPLIMMPCDGDCGFGTDSKFALAAWWLGKAIHGEERTQDLILRYLAAFGPATVADAQAWSALPKLKPVFDALRSRLQVFRDERNRELFDVPNAPRPPEKAVAPVRFLPAFDNIILAHSDRTRIIADEYRPRVTTKNLQVLPTFLVDGFVVGTWEISSRKNTAVLTISPFTRLPGRTKQELAVEAEQLVRFIAASAVQYEVRIQAR